MLGIIISGRPILTESQTISPTQLAFTFPCAPHFSHLVVFLLPGATLPQGQSAAVYLQLTSNDQFRLLGALSNAKQSAIFRVRDGGVKSGVVDEDAMMDADTESGGRSGGEMVTLGISLEPDEQVAASLAASKSSSSSTSTQLQLSSFGGTLRLGNTTATPTPSTTPATTSVSTKVLAQRIIANAYNFLASFSGNGPAGSEVVPLKAFQEWWVKFERRVEVDPGFLERPVD